MKVTVIDSIMGSGKTSWMINKINNDYTHALSGEFTTGNQNYPKYLYITPTLDEVDRVTRECPDLEFKNPEPVNGRKYWHFEKLVREGHNICTTHSLFKLLNRELYAELKDQGYTLVIDEALDCVDLFSDLSDADRNLLMRDNMITVEAETYKLRWNEDQYHDYKGKFEAIMGLCRNGNLVHFKNKTLLWEFPVEFIECFEQVYVLTYLFHGNAMANYLAANKVEWKMMAVQEGKLIPWSEVDESAIKERLRELVHVYEGKSNNIGSRVGKDHPMSSSWYKRVPSHTLDKLRGATQSFFKAIAKTPSKDNAWTTFKDHRSAIAGDGYAKGFLPNNLRGTNDYIDKKSVAYLCNTFYHPIISNYFTQRGVKVYEDLYGLSEMIQWIWRSQIRRHDPIHVFIPSERMRKLFLAWLWSDTIEDLFRKTGSGSPPQMDTKSKLPVLPTMKLEVNPRHPVSMRVFGVLP